MPPFLDKPSPADAADESLHEGKDKSGDIPPEGRLFSFFVCLSRRSGF